jgi:hypothetical protein
MFEYINPMNDSEAEENYKRRQQWFVDRIGRRVYRGKTSCPCAVCTNVSEEGLIIADEMHAHYLHDIEGESHFDSTHPITYVDLKDQV